MANGSNEPEADVDFGFAELALPRAPDNRSRTIPAVPIAAMTFFLGRLLRAASCIL